MNQHRVFIKTHKFPVRVEAEVYAAEQRACGAEAWITYTSRQGYVVTVRIRKELAS